MSGNTQALDAIEREYQDNFARRPRVTRSLAKLDELITKVGPYQTDPEVGARAAEMKGRYQSERSIIAELQAGGQNARNAHRANALCNLFQRRYARHFANKSRRTRDQALLAEMANRLETFLGDMTNIAKLWDHQVFADARNRHQSLLSSVREELTAVPADFNGADVAERAGALATRANHQFRWYRLCFAGKDRATRRQALLERILRELTDVEAGMSAAIQGGYRDDAHNKNLGIVTDSLRIYRSEQAACRNARMQTTDANVYSALANEANGCFEKYRSDFAGKDRKSLDPAGLADVCDQLAELALHMDETDRVRGGNYEANLFIVLENLAVYENEVELIEKARGTTT